ncbi:MAG TPA: helix-turn-helix domain-containing protein [Bacillales bacterium]|nr:helix-turn-helix domain-containing protein [Bacillales bacterium]
MIKEKIFAATIEEFSENGIRFTMDDPATRLRINKRTLYQHIASKEELIGEKALAQSIEIIFKRPQNDNRE